MREITITPNLRVTCNDPGTIGVDRTLSLPSGTPVETVEDPRIDRNEGGGAPTGSD
ncbi:hypothetical protein NLS1_11050 [Nocardioides sp. LS1]|nr:hypothetical protein NLS1_11050 [Nocardioides sp. LS1]